MNWDIRKYRKDIKRKREEIEEDYLLFDIDKDEYERLMNELDAFEKQVNELEEQRKKLKKLKNIKSNKRRI